MLLHIDIFKKTIHTILINSAVMSVASKPPEISELQNLTQPTTPSPVGVAAQALNQKPLNPQLADLKARFLPQNPSIVDSTSLKDIPKTDANVTTLEKPTAVIEQAPNEKSTLQIPLIQQIVQKLFSGFSHSSQNVPTKAQNSTVPFSPVINNGIVNPQASLHDIENQLTHMKGE